MGIHNERRGIGGAIEQWTSWSASSMLLPYLDQQRLCDQCSFDFTPQDGYRNGCISTAADRKLGVFPCPSDFKNNTNYKNDSISGMGPSTDSIAPLPSGIFGQQYGAKIGEITDGTSKTALFGERLRGNGQFNAVASYATAATS